jgi:hypothetical protein
MLVSPIDLGGKPNLSLIRIPKSKPTPNFPFRQLPWITGMKAKPESVYLANQTFVTAALSQLADIPNATTSITYQLITHSWLAAARASGGDAIDLDPANGGFIGESSFQIPLILRLLTAYFSSADRIWMVRCSVRPAVR